LPGILILAVLASLVGGYLWLRPGAEATETDPETVRVVRETLDRTVSATGVIRPRVGAEIDVGSRISGIVRSIPVEVGDRVERGDLLATIDPTEFESDVAQARADLALAEAQLAMARNTHRRAQAMIADGLAPEVELETAAGDLEVARARVARERTRIDAATIRLGYTEIRAPVRGVIADVSTREGETVAASFAAPTFVTIVDLDRLEVQAYVDEIDIGRVFVGQQATFSVDTWPEAEFTARVTAVNPKAELQNGVVNYIVLLEFDRQEAYVLRPEMTAHVRLRIEQRPDALTLPRNAVKRADGRQLVTVLRDGAWIDQPIEAGWRTDHRVEILDGLAEGESVQLNRP
jgi:RND family efflux transporter MFP subunit